MQKTYKRGFTLIELLVVIAIIGILASIVLASLDSARKKGRDARRISDVKEIQLALELYYDAHGVYPPSIPSTLVSEGFISVMPTDPSNQASYSYAPYAATSGGTVCSSYHLGASLETAGATTLLSDADVTTQSISGTETNPTGKYICAISGASADFHGHDSAPCAASGDAGVACYDVTP